MNNEMPVFNPVKSLTDLIIIKSYQVDNVIMADGNRTNVILKKELSDKRIIYRELMITANGSKFLSEEYS